MAAPKLTRNERHQHILTRLNSEGAVRITSLASEFGTAVETIRRDLDDLFRHGLIKRTYGGAARLPFTDEPGMEERSLQQAAERAAIAEHAARHVASGDALMIDAGSTTTAFAKALVHVSENLTVVTNCLPVATLMARGNRAHVLLTPGQYVMRERAVYGTDTLEFLKRFRVNRAVIGAGGLTCDGPTDVDSQGSWVKRTMIGQADQVILLLDSSKLDRVHFEIVCPLVRITHLVTNAAPEPSLARCLRRAGTQVHIAPMSAAPVPGDGA